MVSCGGDWRGGCEQLAISWRLSVHARNHNLYYYTVQVCMWVKLALYGWLLGGTARLALTAHQGHLVQLSQRDLIQHPVRIEPSYNHTEQQNLHKGHGDAVYRCIQWCWDRKQRITKKADVGPKANTACTASRELSVTKSVCKRQSTSTGGTDSARALPLLFYLSKSS